MSIINQYNNPTVHNWNLNQFGEPTSLLRENESKPVLGGKIALEEIPDPYRRVFIDGYMEIDLKQKIVDEFHYKVDYTNGIVFFHSSKEGKTINITKYYGRGMFYTPSSRIWTKIDDLGNVVSTLADMEGDLGEMASQIDAINTMAENANGIATSLATNVTIGTTLNTNLQTSISTATTKKSSLDTSIGTANTTITNINTAISNASTSKSNLDMSIGNASTSKTNLDSSISSANTINNTLSNSTTGTIKKATDINTTINTSIGTANTSKSNLDTSIGSATTSKTNLDGSISTANATKTGLDSSIATGNNLKGELDAIISGTDYEQLVIDVGDLKTDKADKTYVDNELSKKVDNTQVLTDVPLNAKFTDTVYTHPITDGNKHIPTGGVVGQVLKNTTSGTATWQADNDTVTTINGKTGSITKQDIVDLGIPAQDTIYTHPTGTNPHGTTKTDIDLVNVDNVKQMPIAGGTFTGEVNHNRQLVTKPQLKDYSEVAEITTGVTGIKDINLTNANVFRYTLSGATTFTVSNPSPTGQTHSFTLIIQQPVTPVSIIFPASVKWNGGIIPTAPTASKQAIYTFFTVDGGVSWYGSQAMNEVIA